MRGHVARTYYSNKILRRHVAGTCSGDILSSHRVQLAELHGACRGDKISPNWCCTVIEVSNGLSNNFLFYFFNIHFQFQPGV